MAIQVANASLVFKDKSGNTGRVLTLSSNDIQKLKTAVAHVDVVVDNASGKAIEATTTSVGAVQLADATAITNGTAGRVVDAKQLKAVSDAVSALDTSDLTVSATTVDVSDLENGKGAIYPSADLF